MAPKSQMDIASGVGLSPAYNYGSRAARKPIIRWWRPEGLFPSSVMRPKGPKSKCAIAERLKVAVIYRITNFLQLAAACAMEWV